MDLKSRIGEKAGPYKYQVTPDKVARFAKAVHMQERGVIPPTLMTVCRDGLFDLLERFGIPLAKVLHGEQEYVYEGTYSQNDEIEHETSFAQTFTKKGGAGALHFLVFESEARVGTRTVARGRSTIIYPEAK